MVLIARLLAVAGMIGAALGAAPADKAVAPSMTTSSGAAENTTIPVDSLDPNKVKQKFSEEWIYNKTQELFNRTLTRKEYLDRDWMWIRCRTVGSYLFDIGGSWAGKDGRDLKKAVAREMFCPSLHWEYEYVNKRGWGDATLNVGCAIEYLADQSIVVTEALKIVKKLSAQRRRELYIWDCHGFEKFPNFGRQWYGRDWPGKDGDAKGGYQQDDSSRDSMELASQNGGSIDIGGV